MDQKRLLYLIDRLYAGNATPAEERELKDWYNRFDTIEPERAYLEAAGEPLYLEKRYKALLAGIEKKRRRKTFKVVWRMAASAAAVLVAAFIVSQKLYVSNHKMVAVPAKNDAAPGHDGAVLTLADGSRVILDSASEGTVAKQGNTQIINRKGQLDYNAAGAITSQVAYNTLSTPRGRQYRLILPDGTKVWLNAESSVRYPTVFTGPERTVEVTGEAYFEVVHNPAMPFRVKTANCTIEDIGTEFDVNAYADETATKTTLLQGAVKMNGTVLQPGQEGCVEGVTGKIIMRKADTDDAVAWVNGQLSLESDDIRTLMRRIARWYNVDVRFEGSLPHTALFGSVDRNVYLSEVLKALADYGVSTSLKGNIIIVSAK